MSVYRKNMITNDWVIFEPSRDKRPSEFKTEDPDHIEVLKKRSPYKESCPFCRGNEKPEDREIFCIPGESGWSVRVLENKYASLSREVSLTKNVGHMKKEMTGFGIHDVVIDHPHHNVTLGIMPESDIVHLLRAYARRYQEVQQHPLVRHVVLFKNQGILAGGSLEHPHSQIYGLPVMPFETVVRLREVEKYFEFTNSCMLCDIMKDECAGRERIIDENNLFASWVPYASVSPFHIWIVPKKHSPSFGAITEPEIHALANIMRSVLGRVYNHLHNPDFNFIFQSLSRYEKESEAFHWYISIIPHIKRKGGLAYAGGIQLNPLMPESAAEELRNTPVGP